jgi:hypothetical protein
VIFIQCGRADALQLAACEGGLEHVGRIHGALRSSRTDNRVQFVYHHDDIAACALDLFDHCFEPFFKFTTEAGACDHGAQIKLYYAFA